MILSVAGCTDSNTAPQKTGSTDKKPFTEQPTLSPNTEQSISVSTAKESNFTTTSQNKELPATRENLTVDFIDVGQGDSILIKYDNKSILIDAGESDKGEVVSAYLHNPGISTLDYIVSTHPHSNHIGGN